MKLCAQMLWAHSPYFKWKPIIGRAEKSKHITGPSWTTDVFRVKKQLNGGVSHYLNTERVYTAFPALKKCLKLCQHCTASPHSHSGLEQAAACTASSAYSLPASAPEAFYIGTWDFSLFLVTAWSQQCSWKQLLHIWGVSNFRRIQRTGRQVPSLRT